jgi:hypothetical protein
VRNYIRSTPGHPISVSERGPNRRREARACRQRFDMLRAQCGGVPHWPGKIRSVPCADCTGQKQRNSWRPWPHAAPLLRRTQLAEKACASAVSDGWATATPGPRPRRLSRPDRWVHLQHCAVRTGGGGSAPGRLPTGNFRARSLCGGAGQFGRAAANSSPTSLTSDRPTAGIEGETVFSKSTRRRGARGGGRGPLF